MSMSSIYSSLSGMLGFSKGLENSSNNVSNLNTPGFKGRDVFFQELNPYSDGQGSHYDGVKVNDGGVRFTAGDLTTTGNNTDLAIDGAGFFILRGDGENLYTRAGQFRLDNDGYLVDQNSNRRVAALGGGNKLSDLNIKANMFTEASATTKATIKGNIDAGTSEGGTVNSSSDSPLTIDVIDNQGVKRTVRVAFVKKFGSQWAMQLKDQQGNFVAPETIVTFSADGSIRAEDANLSINYLPFSVLSAEKAKEVFKQDGEYAFTDGDFTSAPALAFNLDDEVLFMARNNEGGEPDYIHGGEFSFDVDGNLVVAGSGKRVAGVNSEGVITDFSLKDLKENPAKPTAKVQAFGNLNPELADFANFPAEGEDPISFEVMQSNGEKLQINMEFTKQAANVWNVTLRDTEGELVSGPYSLNFDSNGILAAESRTFSASIPDSDDTALSVELKFYESDSKSLTQKVDATDGVSPTADGKEKGMLEKVTFDEKGVAHLAYSNGNTAEGPRIALVDRGTEATANFDLSLSGLTSLSGVNSVEVSDVDGFEAGRVTEFSFQEDGVIAFKYSNGQEKTGPQVAMANFMNVNALTSEGGSLFRAGEDAGMTIGAANSGGFGKIKGESIELSNVELSREFAEIIIIQRGYQASSQVMNVSNEMIENLYNSVRGR
ncbi:flagellar hook-basal body complex protein [Hahella aquimaris]|uniref:flagellar hook-basal body complex protein n=1 Tax=Hahella sp. HNIBRBA332 TaxID=3015983 RepID=UPI00273AD9BF|nr:flagellar hook-basal body complex protein [Hahella sp. HNIBRBA332]WLQ15711.1 flagellar hook-basal body complex protein [Hahella sp. HNIBRBA332]